MNKALQFIKDWMLPLAIVTGISSYLIVFFIPLLKESVEPGLSEFARHIQPVLVGTMLFIQFNKISPHDLRFKKWHFYLLAVQTIVFVALAFVAAELPEGNARILVESAMLCFICPTAAAAGVITDRLGGSLSDTVSYVVLINIVAAVVIPLVIPIVNPSEDISFLGSFLAICMRVFPLLVFPLILAWTIRYCFRRLQRFLMRFTHWAFYIWGLCLTFAIFLATRAFVHSGISAWVAIMICLVALVSCIIQFVAGRLSGKYAGRSASITAGQALGQKNTGFLIWLGYSFLTPVTSVAGGLYSIWQNLINFWELIEKKRHEMA